ncbi:unnamed protein product, partial [Ectocarpus sp. 4 AP-2014]
MCKDPISRGNPVPIAVVAAVCRGAAQRDFCGREEPGPHRSLQAVAPKHGESDRD